MCGMSTSAHNSFPFFSPSMHLEDDIAEENEYDTMVESLEQAKEENDNNAAELDSLRRELDGARAEATRLAGEAKLLRDDADVEARRERQERERLVSELKQKIEVLEENEKLGEGEFFVVVVEW